MLPFYKCGGGSGGRVHRRSNNNYEKSIWSSAIAHSGNPFYRDYCTRCIIYIINIYIKVWWTFLFFSSPPHTPFHAQKASTNIVYNYEGQLSMRAHWQMCILHIIIIYNCTAYYNYTTGIRYYASLYSWGLEMIFNITVLYDSTLLVRWSKI